MSWRLKLRILILFWARSASFSSVWVWYLPSLAYFLWNCLFTISTFGWQWELSYLRSLLWQFTVRHFDQVCKNYFLEILLYVLGSKRFCQVIEIMIGAKALPCISWKYLRWYFIISWQILIPIPLIVSSERHLSLNPAIWQLNQNVKFKCCVIILFQKFSAGKQNHNNKFLPKIVVHMQFLPKIVEQRILKLHSNIFGMT